MAGVISTVGPWVLSLGIGQVAVSLVSSDCVSCKFVSASASPCCATAGLPHRHSLYFPDPVITPLLVSQPSMVEFQGHFNDFNPIYCLPEETQAISNTNTNTRRPELPGAGAYFLNGQQRPGRVSQSTLRGIPEPTSLPGRPRLPLSHLQLPGARSRPVTGYTGRCYALIPHYDSGKSHLAPWWLSGLACSIGHLFD
jgi:hypothetical protein